MDAMKLALKNKMHKKPHDEVEMPMEAKHEGVDDEMKEKLQGDKAPELHEGGADHVLQGAAEHKPLHSGVIGPEHKKLLEDLLASISHPGRDAISLEERSAPALKAHLGAMGPKKNY